MRKIKKFREINFTNFCRDIDFTKKILVMSDTTQFLNFFTTVAYACDETCVICTTYNSKVAVLLFSDYYG